MEHEPQMALSDDGTLDTVIVCTICHREYRYNFDSEEHSDFVDWFDSDSGEKYSDFADWALADADSVHAEEMN